MDEVWIATAFDARGRDIQINKHIPKSRLVDIPADDEIRGGAHLKQRHKDRRDPPPGECATDLSPAGAVPPTRKGAA